MMAPRWRIHYSGHVVEGVTADEWRAAPDDDVQVVVLLRDPVLEHGEMRWTGVTDRLLWTGDEVYDPFGWGEKRGSLIPDDDYWRCWEEAKACPR
ncbi:hypothetical protein [Dokdonella sp.]|uniref:hypothetical protein n=1 Tax=Dokdonella sp. TaxID=2291710 RepID=UPI0031C388DB|nr:hypothetical protein [Dokdonella sp.]